MRLNDELLSLQGAGFPWNPADCLSQNFSAGNKESDELPLFLLWTARDPTNLMPLKSGLYMEKNQLNSCKQPLLKQQRCSVTRSEGYAKQALLMKYPETPAEGSGNLQ